MNLYFPGYFSSFSLELFQVLRYPLKLGGKAKTCRNRKGMSTSNDYSSTTIPFGKGIVGREIRETRRKDWYGRRYRIEPSTTTCRNRKGVSAFNH